MDVSNYVARFASRAVWKARFAGKCDDFDGHDDENKKGISTGGVPLS